jgi:transposase
MVERRQRRQYTPEFEAEAASGVVRCPAGELETENARLRRELANAKLDNEILRKAAAYFARESR